jgi:putative intracellular protease/amidase
MTKRALVLAADGSEEMETVVVVDVLRRAQV